jgi:hypothetical protein
MTPSKRGKKRLTMEGATLAAAVISALASIIVVCVAELVKGNFAPADQLQTQRLAIYQQVFADSRELGRGEYNFFLSIATNPSRYNRETIMTMEKPIADALIKIDQDMFQVGLIGSFDTLEAASQLRDLQRTEYDDIQKIERDINVTATDEEYNTAIKAVRFKLELFRDHDFTKVTTNHGDALGKFLLAARKILIYPSSISEFRKAGLSLISCYNPRLQFLF